MPATMFGTVSAQESPTASLPSSVAAHDGEVSCAGFTPDGRLLATGGYDATLRLWDLRRQKPLSTLSGHQGLVLGLAISPLGDVLASGGSDNVIKLWDIPADEPEWNWTGHTLPINDVAVRPDGQIAVSVGDDRAVRVWDRQRGSLLQTLEGHQAEVVRAAFRSDGNAWASGDGAGVLKIWTPGKYLDEDPTTARTIFAHDGPISSIAFHPNNQSVLTSGRDGTVKMWQLAVPEHRHLAKASEIGDQPAAEDATTPGRIVAVASNGQAYVAGGPAATMEVFNAADGTARTLEGQLEPVRSLDISPNAAIVASGGETGAIKLWNLADGTDRLALYGHEGAVRDIAFHPDNARLASAGYDGTVRLWKLPTAPQVLAGHEQPVMALAFSANGQFAASGGRDHAVRLWNGASGAAVATGTGHAAAVTAAEFRPDSTQLATGDAGGVVRFWNGTNVTPLGELAGGIAAVTGLAWHPSDERMITSSADGTARLWRLPPPAPWTLSGHTDAIRAAAVSTDGKLLATASSDQSVRLFDITSGNELRQLATQSGEMTSVAFSPDNAIVAAGTAGGATLLRKAADGAELLQVAGHEGAIRAVDFHPELPRLATAGAEGTLRVWSLPQPSQPLAGHTMPVSAADASADGKLIVTGSADKTVRLWNAADGQAIAALTGHEQAITSVRVRSDGSEAVSGDATGTVRFWDVAAKQPGLSIRAADNAVAAIDYDPAASRLLTGNADGTLRLWKLPLTAASQIAEHADKVPVVAATRDGKRVFSGGADGKLQMDQPGGDGPPVVFAGQSGPVAALALNGKETIVATGSDTGQIHGWQVTDGATIFAFQGHTGRVTDVAFQPVVADAAAPSPPLFATTGDDGTLRIWNKPADPQAMQTADQQITGIVGSTDGKYLASSGPVNGRPAIVIRNGDGGKVVATLLGHTGPIRSMQFNKDATKLATGSDDGTARVWDLSDAKFPEIGRFGGHEAAVTAVTLAADGKLAISGAANGTLKIWNILEGTEVHNLAGHTAAVIGLAVLSDGTIVSSADQSVRFWSAASGQQVRTVAAAAVVTAMALSPDASQLLIGTANNSLTAYNPANGQPLFQMPGHANPVRSIAFSRDGQRLASCATDGQCRVWNADGRLRESLAFPSIATIEGQAVGPLPIMTFGADPDTLIFADAARQAMQQPLALQQLIVPADSPLLSVAFTPAGDQLVTAGADKVVRLWNVAEGKEVRQFAGHTDVVTAVAISPDGASIISGSADKSVRVWTLADGKESASLSQPAAVRSLALSTDGQRVAISGDDALVQVCDPTTSQILQSFAGHQGTVAAVSFAADDQAVISGSDDKSVRLWPIAAERVFVAGDGPVKQVAFVGDGNRFAAIVGQSPSVQIRDLTGNEATELTAGEMPLESLAVDPKAAVIAAGGADKKIYRWTLNDAKPLPAIEMPAAVTRLASAASPIVRNSIDSAADADDQHVDFLVAGDDNRVRIIDAGEGRTLEIIETGAASSVLVPLAGSRRLVTIGADNTAAIHQRCLLKVANAHQGGVNDIAYSPDGKQLVSGGVDGKIRIWNDETGEHVLAFTAAAPPAGEEPETAEAAGRVVGVTSVSVTADGQRLAVGTSENRAQVWDLKTAAAASQPITAIEHPVSVTRVHISSDGGRLATMDAANTIRLFDLSRELELERIASGLPAEQPLFDLVVGRDRETVIAVGMDKLVHLWKASALQVWQAHQQSASDVVFIGDGTKAATSGADKAVRVWTVAGEAAAPVGADKPLLELTARDGEFTNVIASADGGVLTAAGVDQKLYSWNLADGAIASVTETPAAVTGMALAGDPPRLAVAGADGHVRIFSPSDGRRLEEISIRPTMTPAGETAAAESETDDLLPPMRIALNPDASRILVNAGNEGRFYDLSLLKVFSGHEGPVATAAFTPDGAKLITGGDDRTLRVWQVEDGAPLRMWSAHDAEVTALSVMPDGKTIASASLDQSLRLWPIELPAEAAASQPATAATTAAADAGTEMPPQAVFRSPAAIRSLHPSADGLRIASACDDGFVRIWDVAAGRELERFQDPDGPATSVAFVPDNLRVVSGGANGGVHEWRISATRLLPAHQAAVNGLAYLANGAQWVTASVDGAVRLWDQNMNPVREFGLPAPPAAEPTAAPAAAAAADAQTDEISGPRPVGTVTALAVRRDGTQLTVAVVEGEGDSAAGKLLTWNVANGELLRTDSVPAVVHRLDYSPDNLKLAATCADQKVRIFGTTEFEIQQVIATAQNARFATFAPDSRQVLLGGDEPNLQTWRYVSPTAVRTLTGHGGSVYSLKFTPDGSRLVSCSIDGTIRVWNTETGQQLASLTGHQGAVTAIDLSPDGALLVSAGADATVRLWDVTGGRQLKQLAATESAVYSVAFNRDGKLIAAGGADKQVFIYNAVTGALQSTIDQHEDHVYRVAFSPSSDRLMSLGYSGDLFVWNVAGGKPLLVKDVCRVAFSACYSPDGAVIAVTGGDGEVHFTSVPAAVR